jgi:hypothetical protein
MRRRIWMAAVFVTLTALGRASCTEPSCCKPPEESFLKRLRPVGGWCPYGTGPLGWWNAHWFPCCGGVDDYCRKPLPPFGWPAYSPYYIWGPPECCPAAGKAHP